MTQQQEEHLQKLKDEFCEMLDGKYRAGVVEHGGNIWDMTPAQLKKEAYNEIIDLWVYMRTDGNDR